MRYINELGLIGNIKRLFKSVSDNNTVICNNHAETKALLNEDEAGLIEVAQTNSDTEMALIELTEQVAELTEAIMEMASERRVNKYG